jgi:hypothetical protein
MIGLMHYHTKYATNMKDDTAHLHSHASGLWKFIAYHGGFEHLQLTDSTERYACFSLVSMGEVQTSYVDHFEEGRKGCIDFAEWKQEVEWTVNQIGNLSAWFKETRRARKKSNDDGKRLNHELFKFLFSLGSETNDNHQQFVLLYLTLLRWYYRKSVIDWRVGIQDISECFERFGCVKTIQDLTFTIIDTNCGGKFQKWRVIRMIRVVQRVSPLTKQFIKDLCLGILGFPQKNCLDGVALSRRIYAEAL